MFAFAETGGDDLNKSINSYVDNASITKKNSLSSATNRAYMVIDLKSFYASVECVERDFNPLTTNLVVADPDRKEATICLAITPSMKKLGIKNRCRLYEIPSNVKYIIAPPRMKLYIDYATRVYSVFLKYLSKDDIHVYSIDESFLDVTGYLSLYKTSPIELAKIIMKDVLDTTGITATCGIGTNLYLAKIALDITAKHCKDNIGYLDEQLYCKTLWHHKPLTDFWRIGNATQRKLANIGIHDMQGIANADEQTLYRMFGIDAELLIDHSWGREVVTISDIKKYKTKSMSLSSSQVLPRDYSYEEGELAIKEMADLLCLDLVEKAKITESVTIFVGYSFSYECNPTGGTVSLRMGTSSAEMILPAVVNLYKKVAHKSIAIRRIGISFNDVIDNTYQQLDIFTDMDILDRERKLQKAMINIKHRYGKNAVLKGMNLLDAARTMERNEQIGGHKANG